MSPSGDATLRVTVSFCDSLTCSRGARSRFRDHFPRRFSRFHTLACNLLSSEQPDKAQTERNMA